MVSIVIPSHNRRHTLPLLIESLQRQTYPHWEGLIVDDDSRDGTADLIKIYGKNDDRVRLLSTDENRRGANVARNIGVAASTGSYLIFLDSDDALADFCLEQRVAQMEARPELDFGVWPTLLFSVKPGDSTLLWNVATAEDDLDRFLALDIPWQTAGAMWRRAALQKTGRRNETLPSWQDWEYHLRALALGLRYEKFERPDSYWRTPREDSTWNRSYRQEHLEVRRGLLVEIEELLRREGKLGERQKKLLAGLYFWHARVWYSKLRKRFRGLAEWQAAWRRGLVDAATFLQGCRWFSKLTRGSAREPRSLFPGWPAEYLAGSSKTFQAVPYRAL